MELNMLYRLSHQMGLVATSVIELRIQLSLNDTEPVLVRLSMPDDIEAEYGLRRALRLAPGEFGEVEHGRKSKRN